MNDTLPEEVGRPWDAREGEPSLWYRIFKDYYLPLGNRRSLRTAFEFYLRVERPVEYEQEDPSRISRIPSNWAKASSEWEWASRAMAYDQEQMPDFAAQYILQTLEYLRSNGLAAGMALVKALNSERTRVPAANSILNRIGVPETSNVSLIAGVSITSDDMAAAASKVDEWKTRRQTG